MFSHRELFLTVTCPEIRLVPVIVLLLASYDSASSIKSPTSPDTRDGKEQAQAQALIGHNQLHLDRLSDAQANCDSALKLDPANETARNCLDSVAVMLIDQDLNNADAKLLSDKKSDALVLASKWARDGAAPNDRRKRAWDILAKARSTSLKERYIDSVPSWLREVLVTTIVLITFGVCLLVARRIRRIWGRGKWYGDVGKTRWSMLPLKEIPADARTGIPTDAVLDALARLGHELERDLWKPRLLLLRPTPPANYEPALISDFLCRSLGSAEIVLVPAAKDLCLEWQLHDIQLSEAVQDLQLKASGVDIGSVARLLRNIVEWFNAGAPTISGVAHTNSNDAVSIHLAASGGQTHYVSVTSSTSSAPGIDPIQLSAERTAIKFMYRLRYPHMTNEEIDGFSALRQGACQFAQFGGTVTGVGNDAKARTSTLAKAAFNFGFFRASIPPHCDSSCSKPECTSLALTDDNRQAILLAEGVAHSLVGEAPNLMSAIDCFRQLEDWPGSSPKTLVLRQQAKYNEAIVWRQMGFAGRCVLMLTELLGQRAPDTVEGRADQVPLPGVQKYDLPDSVRFPVRLARVAAFATYNRDDWSALPESRAQLLIDDAEELVQELASLCDSDGISEHDRRLASYMYVETLRAIGHVELLHVISTAAATLYENKRPTGLRTRDLSTESSIVLHRAISWMLKCEELAPSCELFCDLAEAYLLLKDFTKAEGYARHATLESNAHNERAYYIATESFLLQNTATSLALAKKYALDFKGTVSLDEFKAVRKELDINEGITGNQGPTSNDIKPQFVVPAVTQGAA